MARTVRPEPAGSDSDVPPKSHHASGKKSKSGDKKRKGSSSGPAGASKGKRAKKDSLGKSAGLRATKSLKTEVCE